MKNFRRYKAVFAAVIAGSALLAVQAPAADGLSVDSLVTETVCVTAVAAAFLGLSEACGFDAFSLSGHVLNYQLCLTELANSYRRGRMLPAV